MDYRNELLDQWVGNSVILQYQSGPNAKNMEGVENWMDAMYDTPGLGYEGAAKHRTAVYELLSYDSIGIVVKTLEEGSAHVFHPWGAVISIQGPMEEDEGQL